MPRFLFGVPSTAPHPGSVQSVQLHGQGAGLPDSPNQPGLSNLAPRRGAVTKITRRGVGQGRTKNIFDQRLAAAGVVTIVESKQVFRRSMRLEDLAAMEKGRRAGPVPRQEVIRTVRFLWVGMTGQPGCPR